MTKPAKKIDLIETKTGTVRKRKYLSPSAVNLFKKSPDDFYLKYLAQDRPEDYFEQSEAMAIGGGFDSFVKLKLAEDHGDTASPHGRIRTWEELAGISYPDVESVKFHAGRLAHLYERSGAFGELREACATDVQFELTVIEDVDGVPVMGKPDLIYTDADGVNWIRDWKVNGSASQSMPSPISFWNHKFSLEEGKDGWQRTINSRNQGANKHNVPKPHRFQLATYALALGWGADTRFAIDQIRCQRISEKVILPEFVISEGTLSEADYQAAKDAYAMVWEFCHEPSIVLSTTAIKMLDRTAADLRGDNGDVAQTMAREI